LTHRVLGLNAWTTVAAETALRRKEALWDLLFGLDVAASLL
jgi:hypothetical protein